MRWILLWIMLLVQDQLLNLRTSNPACYRCSTNSSQLKCEKMRNDWCFRPWFCTVRLYWARDNLGEWDEFCYESCPCYRIHCSTCWPAVQCATTLPQTPLNTRNCFFIKYFLSMYSFGLWIILMKRNELNEIKMTSHSPNCLKTERITGLSP